MLKVQSHAFKIILWTAHIVIIFDLSSGTVCQALWLAMASKPPKVKQTVKNDVN